MALLNTHATVKKFMQHGFSEEQAEVVVDAINDQSNNLVTKEDLRVSISELKADLFKWVITGLIALMASIIPLWFK
ncbi:DUF1640 domain-containing protein [Candidatus Megaera polyxenophila]|nr:DUF1640 domain-containing protein [Candidatus Megaera polyxenophila]